jgi:hypothetical protein
MPSASRKPSNVPARPLLSDAPDPPGVYHSLHQTRNRWIFYALGLEGMLLDCRVPRLDELDDDVIAQLAALVPDEPRPTTLQLLQADVTDGFSPSLHRPLSLPRLVP